VAGVNEGLTALQHPPFEYSILGIEAEEWTVVDSILTIFSQYIFLQQSDIEFEIGRGLLKDELPESIFNFITSLGTIYDSPIIGPPLELPAIPDDKEAIDFLKSLSPKQTASTISGDERLGYGSNGWVVSGSRTKDGRGILASDMHLDISVPNIWYRSTINYETSDGMQQVAGLTSPGTPLLIAGTNKNIAWSYTYNFGDWMDLIAIEYPSSNKQTHYKTPNGIEQFKTFKEVIHVNDSDSVEIEVKETIWGPVITQNGMPYALKWLALSEDAINLSIISLESATDVLDALKIIPTIKGPSQNVLVADSSGNIGWSLLGPLPKRGNDYSGAGPYSWERTTIGWDWVSEENYPQLYNPEAGFIASANARHIPESMITDSIGEGFLMLGARQYRANVLLKAADTFDVNSFLTMQLDTHSSVLVHWKNWILIKDKLRTNRTKAYFSRIEQWDGTASDNTPGYLEIKYFRDIVDQSIFEYITQNIKMKFPEFDYRKTVGRTREGALWQIINHMPALYLPKGDASSWSEFFIDKMVLSLDHVEQLEDKKAVHRFTYKHPLSPFVPLLSYLTDMPEEIIPGDTLTLRAQDVNFGASVRFAVSPGDEASAMLHMPTSQTGHPFSPYYGKAHEAWVKGYAMPLLGGSIVYSMTLVPRKSNN